MKVRFKFNGYDKNKYTKPWCAVVVDWPRGKGAALLWGEWEGDPENGGEAVIEAPVGALVRWGQKERRGAGSSAYWGIVTDDSSQVRALSFEDAKKYWLNEKPPKPEGVQIATRAMSSNGKLGLHQYKVDELLDELMRRGVNISIN